MTAAAFEGRRKCKVDNELFKPMPTDFTNLKASGPGELNVLDGVTGARPGAGLRFCESTWRAWNPRCHRTYGRGLCPINISSLFPDCVDGSVDLL